VQPFLNQPDGMAFKNIGVEDITQYKTVLVDGVKTKVEVMPEEMKPDSTWLVADIKLWLDAQRIPYVGNASKTDLLALV
jgi:hypothetical protein